MNPIAFAFPMAAITAMLFLLWSDFAGRGRSSRWWVMFLRAALFVGVVGVLLVNRFRFPGVFRQSGTDALVFVAIAIGIAGAAYYLRRGLQFIRGDVGSKAVEDEPLPSIFGERDDVEK